MEENKNVVSLSGAAPIDVCARIVNIIDSKKAHNIKVLKIDSKTVIADYFVICSGTSNTQIKSIADEVQYKMSLADMETLHIDGFNEGTWIVMDYGSVLLHVFNSEMRNFFNLEKLWNDSVEIDPEQFIEKTESN